MSSEESTSFPTESNSNGKSKISTRANTVTAVPVQTETLDNLNKNTSHQSIPNAEGTSTNNHENDLLDSIFVRSPIIQINNLKSESKILNNNKNINSEKLKKDNRAFEESNSTFDKLPKKEKLSKFRKSGHRTSPKIKRTFTNNSLQFISEHLKGVIFSGWVSEREYVDSLKSYRDIIEVDEWEKNMNHRLKMVMYNVKGVMEGTKWINITVPSTHSSSYCLWVLLDSPPYPGHYWMQVTDVTSDTEIGLKISVKILREISAFDGETKEQREKRLKGDIISPNEWKEFALALANLDLKSSLLTVFSPSNISSGFRLLIILSVTFIVAFSTFLQKTWLFLLRLLREMGIFIHHATPIAQTVVGFIEKIIGGFYLLLAMVYRDLRQSRGPPPPNFLPPPTNTLPAPRPRPLPPPLKFVGEDSWVYKEDSD